jgi:hypothetical protein
MQTCMYICTYYVYICVYIYTSPVQAGPGAHPASCKMGTGSLTGIKCGRGVLLATHPLLVPRSWKSRATPLPTLWATPGLYRDHFTFTFYIYIYIYIYIHNSYIIHTYICTHIHIYLPTDMCIHTHKHTYIHTTLHN